MQLGSQPVGARTERSAFLRGGVGMGGRLGAAFTLSAGAFAVSAGAAAFSVSGGRGNASNTESARAASVGTESAGVAPARAAPAKTSMMVAIT